MDKDQIKKSRQGAVSLKFDLEAGDRVVDLISRESGLFVVTLRQILRVKSPDELDPNLEHADAPWEQSVHLPHGSTDPIVARTVLQTSKLANIFFGQRSHKYRELMDISWEVMNSLISIRVIKDRLEKRISEIAAIVDKDLESYTKGKAPKPLPIVEYYEIEFRSFVNEVRRVLTTISNLFSALTGHDFGQGHFHRALEWARKERGEQSLLAQMLGNDQKWIKLWIEMRIAIEHPKKDRFIETLNFSLEADRRVRLPTWRFVHPDYDMGRPQNLLVAFENSINNILKFYEDLQVSLVDGHLPRDFKVELVFIEEQDRDPAAPMRMDFRPFISGAAGS
jgi:hypothetical protein